MSEEPNTPPEPKTFSLEYVRELREENKGLRLAKTNAETRTAAAEAAAATAKTEAEAAIAAAKAEAETKVKEADAKASDAAKAAQTAADERIIRAELRTVAVAAGMKDLDGLKLADISTVKLNDKGEVEGADALMTSLKESKAYLFGEPPKTTTTNTQTTPPAPNPIAPKKASEMTDDEYKAALKSIDAGKGMPT